MTAHARHPASSGFRPAAGEPSAETALEAHLRAHRACTTCVSAGWIDTAQPVFSGRRGQRVLLVGQAPGPVEPRLGRPFAGRAGRELMRWLTRAGFASEADVRDRVWMTSVTTCFPGRRPDGSGDRRPSAPEVRACSVWLDGLLPLLRPRLVIVVGTLALSRLLPAVPSLDAAVGSVVGLPRTEPPLDALAVPLPHPSGQSRWLNDPARRARLEEALATLRLLVVAVDGPLWPPPGLPPDGRDPRDTGGALVGA
jgi:uracil-DNA glycosylase